MTQKPDQLRPELKTGVTLPANFSLARYRFSLEAVEPLHLPPLKGSALRGGFGHTFKRLVCRQPWPCDKSCRLGNACPYGYIFETAPPPDTEVLRNFSELPRPFVILSPVDRRSQLPAGEKLAFGLTLVGQGAKYLPHFIAVFRELGRVGLGRTQGRYCLLQVETVDPYTGQSEAVYQARGEVIRGTGHALNSEAITAYAAALPEDRLALEFLTPTRLKYRGQWVQQGPPFPALIQTLLGRISSLSHFHCGQPFEADFRGLIDRAAGVEISESDTRWEDWSRFSGRQKQRIDMGGLVGRVVYQGDLGPYRPLLALGELIHVGKGTVFGNGQYRVTGGKGLGEKKKRLNANS